MTQGAIEPSPELDYLPEVSLFFDPDDLTEAELNRLVLAQEAHDDPKHAMHHALLAWHLWATRHLREDLSKGLIAYDRSGIAGAIDTLWQIYFPIFQRATAPSLASAYTQGFLAAKAGQVDQEFIYTLANQHAKRIGDYYHETSREALLQGFNGFVNRKVAAKTAAERALAAYGLTPRQMTGYVAMEPEKAIQTVSPLDLKAKIKAYLATSIAQRLKVLVNQEDHNLHQQAAQTAWLWMIQHGQMDPSTEKVWFTAKDERVCPICGPMHGKAVPVGERFVTDEGAFYVPGVHVNCRCWVKIRVPRKAEVQKDLNASELFEFNREHPRGRSGQFAHKPRKVVGVMERTKTNQGFDQIMRDLAARTQPIEQAATHVEQPTYTPVEISSPVEIAPPRAQGTFAPVELESTEQTYAPIELDAPASSAVEIAAPGQVPSWEIASSTKRPVEIDSFERPQLGRWQKPKRYRETIKVTPLHEPVFALLTPKDMEMFQQTGDIHFTHDRPFSSDELAVVSEAAQHRDNLMTAKFNELTQDGEVDYIRRSIPDHRFGQMVQMRITPQQVDEILQVCAAISAGEMDEDDDTAYVMISEYSPEDETHWADRLYKAVDVAGQLGFSPDDFKVGIVRVDSYHNSRRGSINYETGTKHGYERISLGGQYQITGDETDASEVPGGAIHGPRIPIYNLEPFDPEVVREEIQDD